MRAKVRNYHLKEAGALFVLGAGINAAHAQSVQPPVDASTSPDDGVVVLGEIVVTGERVDRALADTVTPVTMVPGDNPLFQSPTSDIDDVATIAPNVYNTSRTGLPIVRGIQGGGAIAFHVHRMDRADLARPRWPVTLTVAVWREPAAF